MSDNKRDQFDEKRSLGRPATIRVSLELRGFDRSPAEVTRKLGLAPTHSGKAGEPYQTVTGKSTQHRLTHDYWALWSNASRGSSLEDHIVNILNQVEPVLGKMDDAVGDAERLLRCTIIGEDEPPLLTLSSSLLERIARARMSLTIDTLSIGPDR